MPITIDKKRDNEFVFKDADDDVTWTVINQANKGRYHDVLIMRNSEYWLALREDNRDGYGIYTYSEDKDSDKYARWTMKMPHEVFVSAIAFLLENGI